MEKLPTVRSIVRIAVKGEKYVNGYRFDVTNEQFCKIDQFNGYMVVHALDAARKLLNKGLVIIGVTAHVDEEHMLSVTQQYVDALVLEWDRKRVQYYDTFDKVTISFDDMDSLRNWLNDRYKGGYYHVDIAADVARDMALRNYRQQKEVVAN